MVLVEDQRILVLLGLQVDIVLEVVEVHRLGLVLGLGEVPQVVVSQMRRVLVLPVVMVMY